MATANSQISADHDSHFQKVFLELFSTLTQVQGLKYINITGVKDVLLLNNIGNFTATCHKDFLALTDGI